MRKEMNNTVVSQCDLEIFLVLVDIKEEREVSENAMNTLFTLTVPETIQLLHRVWQTREKTYLEQREYNRAVHLLEHPRHGQSMHARKMSGAYYQSLYENRWSTYDNRRFSVSESNKYVMRRCLEYRKCWERFLSMSM